MYYDDHNPCVNLWVAVADALGLCAHNAFIPSIDDALLLERAKSLSTDTKQLLLNQLRACPEARIWNRVARLAKRRAGVQTPNSFESIYALRFTLTQVLKDLMEGGSEVRQILNQKNLDASHLERLHTILESVKGGHDVLYLSALCDCLDPGISNLIGSSTQNACSIQASHGVWKKKSSYAHNYGSNNIVYSSCAHKAAWTLIICLGIAIFLCMLDGDFFNV